MGAGLLIIRGSGARKAAVPFGPFLALGGVIGLLAGDQTHRLVPERLRSLGTAFHQSWVCGSGSLPPMGEEAQGAPCQ